MGSEWLDRWEEAQDLRWRARQRRRRDEERMRAYLDPQCAPDADEDEPEEEPMPLDMQDDWYWRKYGPDERDVAFEKRRAIEEDRDDDPPDFDEDNDVDEARLAHHDKEAS